MGRTHNHGKNHTNKLILQNITKIYYLKVINQSSFLCFEYIWILSSVTTTTQKNEVFH